MKEQFLFDAAIFLMCVVGGVWLGLHLQKIERRLEHLEKGATEIRPAGSSAG